MAHFHISKPWQSVYIRPTDENIYHQRRGNLKQLGLLSAGLLTAPSVWAVGSHRSATSRQPEQKGKEAPSFTFDGMEAMYPAERNYRYQVEGREMTKEYDATHYDNFYEFIHPSDSNIYNAYKYVNKFDTSDWKFEVSGAAKNKGRCYLSDIMKKNLAIP